MRYIKGNIERVVESGSFAEQKLLSSGFKPLDLEENKKVEKPVESDRDSTESNHNSVGFGEMTVDELRAKAKEKGIKGVSALSKSDLIKVLGA